MASLAARFLLAILLVGSIKTAWGQNAPSSEYSSAQSSGLRASIGAINTIVERRSKVVSIQIILENITSNRIYLFAVGGNQAAISDGQSLKLEDVIGLTYCKLQFHQEKNTRLCVERHGGDLNYYSYIDSGGKSALSIRYLLPDHLPREYVPLGSLSFRLIMVSRVASALPNSLEAQANPNSISSPHLIVLNFPLIPLNVID